MKVGAGIKLLGLLLMGAGLAHGAVENGAAAPDFSLPTATGEVVTLSEHAGKVVVLEWVNPGCPFVKKFYSVGAMQRFQAEAAAKGVVWLAINSTNPAHGDYMDQAESAAWAAENGVNAPWLLDEDGAVGKAYGARTTPHIYIIDAAGKVVYQGAIDSIRDAKPSSIDEATNYVMEGLTAVLAGGSPEPAQTRPYGCSVKYP